MNKLWHRGCCDIIKKCVSTGNFWKTWPTVYVMYSMINATHLNSVWGLYDSRVDAQFQSFHITLNHIQPFTHVQQISALPAPLTPSPLDLNLQHNKPFVISLHVCCPSPFFLWAQYIRDTESEQRCSFSGWGQGLSDSSWARQQSVHTFKD